MFQEKGFCGVCDHKIVPGVACDGMPEECPSHTLATDNRHRISDFAVTVDKVTGEREFDCVRGID